MAPVAIGLMLSGTYTIARLSIMDAVTLGIALASFAILFWRHVYPAVLVMLGGLICLLLSR